MYPWHLFLFRFFWIELTIFTSQLKLQEISETRELAIIGCHFIYKPLSLPSFSPSKNISSISATILLNGTRIGDNRNIIVIEKLVDGLLWEYAAQPLLVGGYDQIGDYQCRIEVDGQTFLSEATNVHNIPGI